jgi:hypothetical protein
MPEMQSWKGGNIGSKLLTRFYITRLAAAGQTIWTVEVAY